MADEGLVVEGIEAAYTKGMPILSDVSMRAQEGSVTAIIGPNGAGKSTLIKAIAGLVRVSNGTVMLRGRDITNPRPDALKSLGLAYVPQSDNVFRSLTVAENIALSLRHAGSAADGRRAELFARFPDLATKTDDRAAGLSGGQRQFLALAMALAAQPNVLLLDEPSAGLSPMAAEDVLAQVRSLADGGVTVLLVEQNVRQALSMADHCYILADGKNQIDGPARRLSSDPIVGEIYLGGKRMRAS